MTATLTLRHLWTSTGAPMVWSVDGDDEAHLRSALGQITEYSADPEKRSAVLIAHDADGNLIGAWNRDGAASLARLVLIDPPSERWVEIRNNLLDGVSGP